MKFYEKPMAVIETIEVEDVITASDIQMNDATVAALAEKTQTQDVIVFQW